MTAPLRSVDVTFRRAQYRLAEYVRREGATVRPAGAEVRCSTCPRVMTGAPDYVLAGDRSWTACLPCGIAAGVLEKLPESVARRAAERGGRGLFARHDEANEAWHAGAGE